MMLVISLQLLFSSKFMFTLIGTRVPRGSVSVPCDDGIGALKMSGFGRVGKQL
jgi:hypothetical protein